MDKLKMAIIGAGTWGQTHASIYEQYPMVEITAVCDAQKDRALAFAKRFNIPETQAFTDHRAMIAQCAFDACAVVTPDFAHRDAVVDLANAKKHILCEKPMATTRQDVADIMEAIARNNVRLMVDLHNRWSPPFAAAKAAIDQGDIGTPWSAYMRLNDTLFVPTKMLSWSAQSSIMWFLGTHSTDTLRWCFDDEIKRVYAVSRRGILDGLGVHTEDVYQTIYEFRKGGIATMENGWVTPDTHPHINDMKFNISGTKGMVSMDLSNHNMIQQFTEKGVTVPDVLVNNYIHGKAAGFAYESIRHFIDRMLDGKPFLVTPTDAANTSLVIIAALESAKTREPVEVAYL